MIRNLNPAECALIDMLRSRSEFGVFIQGNIIAGDGWIVSMALGTKGFAGAGASFIDAWTRARPFATTDDARAVASSLIPNSKVPR